MASPKDAVEILRASIVDVSDLLRSEADPELRRQLGVVLAETLYRDYTVDRAFLVGLVGRLSDLLNSTRLGRVMARWHLLPQDAAQRFGVSSSELESWLREGPPPGTEEEIEALYEASEVLARYLQPDAIPEVVRRRSPALGHRSLIELWLKEGAFEVLRATEEMFDFSGVGT